MTVLITGAVGYLGSYLSKGLQCNKVFKLGRNEHNHFHCDISREIPVFDDENFDLVIHCAGKAHFVPKNEKEAEEFHKVNYLGTVNLLTALDQSLPGSFVFISTVAVYGQESGVQIDENSKLNGDSPYAKSKIAAEKLILDWGSKNNIPILILRLPLIVGSNPPGNLDKMISGIKKGTYFNIGGGKARRSMVLAEDVAMFIKDNVGKSGIYNLTDGEHPSFSNISNLIARQLGKSKPHSIPFWLARVLGFLGDLFTFFPVNNSTIDKMTNDLTFDDSKARKELGWRSRRVLDHFNV